MHSFKMCNWQELTLHQSTKHRHIQSDVSTDLPQMEQWCARSGFMDLHILQYRISN